MIATIPSATLLGVEGRPISVEVHVSTGLPSFNIVGLPDASCREARDRVRAALISSKFGWPSGRITINLAPTGLRKAGSQLDLALAVCVLVWLKKLPPSSVADTAFLGELSLDGSIRPLNGTVALVDAIESPRVVVPKGSEWQASLVGKHEVLAVSHLQELVEVLTASRPWPPLPPMPKPEPLVFPELADVQGQPFARLGLELAAAGGHHLLMVGPPGSGKSMLANRLVGLLPPLERSESLEVTRIHSAAGLPIHTGLVAHPPFRAPHHGSSVVAITGGGYAQMRPGEISMAHHGVLFLDELGEFAATTIDSLRQPLEDGVIRISRAAGTVTFPARVLLVAAMNPCPCGYGMTFGSCECTASMRQRYRRRLSGPILDRFDLRIDIAPPTPSELLSSAKGETTAVVAKRVLDARQRARERGVACNALLSVDQLDHWAPLSKPATSIVETLLKNGYLSGRGLHRVRRVALTIADCANQEGPLTDEHLAMALQLRSSSMSLFQSERISNGAA